MIYNDNGPFAHMSAVGLGCWNFGGQWNKVSKQEAINIIRYAIDNGMNFVDVAESYGVPDGQCEQILGEALKDGYRERIILITKIGWYGRRTSDHFSAVDSKWDKLGKRIFNKLWRFKEVDFRHRTPELLRLCGHACCGRLQTSYVDLMLCHDGNPSDMESFIEAFRILKKEGFIKHYGISTDSADVLEKFHKMSNQECAAVECDFSLLNKSAEKKMFKYCNENNIAIFTRGTLCRGLLSGKYDENTHFEEPSRLEWNEGGKNRGSYLYYMNKIKEIRSHIGEKSLPQLAYRYAFSVPEHPAVVTGCTSMEQIIDNIKIGSFYLDNDTMTILKKI